MSSPRAVASAVAEQQSALRDRLPFGDTQDFDDARRGLVAPIEEPVVATDGTVLWDNSTYEFLQGEAPDSVNPSLARQSRLATVLDPGDKELEIVTL